MSYSGTVSTPLSADTVLRRISEHGPCLVSRPPPLISLWVWCPSAPCSSIHFHQTTFHIEILVLYSHSWATLVPPHSDRRDLSWDVPCEIWALCIILMYPLCTIEWYYSSTPYSCSWRQGLKACGKNRKEFYKDRMLSNLWASLISWLFSTWIWFIREWIVFKQHEIQWILPRFGIKLCSKMIKPATYIIFPGKIQ